MKVIEKGTDRKAEVHMFVEGSVAELDEYAERVNPVDKAIECFVAVEEGQHPKIGGRLWATAMCYGYDAFIDGICRKANVTVGKAVTAHKSKKLDVDKFLYRTSDDRIIEAKVHVAPLPDEVVPKEGAVENLGTIELRVYVERRFGDEHALQDVITYYQVPGEGYTAGQTVGFKDIAPEYSMGYDENTATLESSSINKSRNKMGKKRPGAEPWAIFRFHLRSMNSIDEKGLPMTFDNSSKKNNRGWRELELEPLPALTIGASPKNLASSRATPAASSAPCTPAKSSTDALWLTPKTPSSKQFATLTTATKNTLNPTAEAPDRPSTPDTSEHSEEEVGKNFLDTFFSSPNLSVSSPKLYSTALSAPVTKMDPGVTLTEFNGTTDIIDEVEISDSNDGNQSSSTTDGVKEDEHAGDKSAVSGTLPDTNPKLTNGTKADATSAPKSSVTQMESSTNTINGIASKPPAPQVQKPAMLTNGTAPKSPVKKAEIQEPTEQERDMFPLLTPTVEKNAVTPTKRPTTPMSTSSTPEIKRPRLSPQPTSRTLYPAPSVKGRPTVSQVVEARKRLQETKAKREATFKKQVEVTSKLSPYELQIQAQLEKLARDDEEQRRMHEQEEQRLHEDMALLQELQSQKMEE